VDELEEEQTHCSDEGESLPEMSLSIHPVSPFICIAFYSLLNHANRHKSNGTFADSMKGAAAQGFCDTMYRPPVTN
jgi:hypothetical protein